MKGLRQRLRLAVTVWLVFQAVSLSALVPLDCCDAHRSANAAAARQCHEKADSPYCPMRAREGTACPMHQKAESDNPHAHHQAAAADEPASAPSYRQCVIGGTCSAPLTALAVILSNHGVIPRKVLIPANAHSTLVPQHHHDHLTSRQATPDSPPPRA